MYELIEANKRKSVFIVVGMGILLGSFGFIFAFVSVEVALWVALGCMVLWLLSFAFSWVVGEAVILKVARAYPMKELEYHRLINVVEEVSIAAGIPTPRVYIINSPYPNAFALGKTLDRSRIAVTTGLLKRLNRDELQAVIAHEVAHIYNRDALYMTVLISCVGLIALLAELAYYVCRGAVDFGFDVVDENVQVGVVGLVGMVVGMLLFALLAPLFSELIYLAASRRREYLADLTAVSLTRHPNALASALMKISEDLSSSKSDPSFRKTVAPLYIVNPFTSRFQGIWSTHPPLERRLQLLREVGADLKSIQRGDMSSVQRSIQSISGYRVPLSFFQQFAPITPITEGEDREGGEALAEAVGSSATVIRQCWHCAAALRAPAHLLGAKVQCRKCHNFTRLSVIQTSIFVLPSGKGKGVCLKCETKFEVSPSDKRVRCPGCHRFWRVKVLRPGRRGSRERGAS